MLKPQYDSLKNQASSNTTPEKETEQYTASVNDQGVQWTPVEKPVVQALKEQTLSEIPNEPPISIDEIEKVRKFPVVRRQYEQMHGKKLLEYGRWIKAKGPEIEKALGVSTREMFLKGNSTMAAKLHRENPLAYRLLRDFVNYL